MARKIDRQTLEAMTDDSVSDALNRYVKALKSINTSISNIQEQLSEKDLRNILTESKEIMRSMGLFSDAQLDAIQDMTKLRQVMTDLSKKSDEVANLQGVHHQKYIKIQDRLARSSMSVVQKEMILEAAHEKYARSQARAAGMTDQMFETLYKGVPHLERFFFQTEDNISSLKRFGKETEKLTDSLKNQVKGFFTLDNAVSLLKKSVSRSYDEMSRLTSQGMLGAMMEINIMSKKLLMTTEEFQKAVQDNRQYINTLGGGVQGIAKFGNQVGDIQKQIMFLGKHAGQAAVKLTELSLRSGFVENKQGLFQKNTQKSIEQFKKFNAMFGDSAEAYQDLMLSQQKEENIQSRLNNLKGQDLLKYQDELRIRTEMLKNLGLSNDQIKAFNQKLENLYNPREDNYEKQVKDAVYFRSGVDETIRSLTSTPGKTPEETQRRRDAASKMMKYKQQYEEVASTFPNLSPEEKTKLLSRPDMQEATAALNSGVNVLTQSGDALESRNSNIFLKESGTLGEYFFKQGGDLNTARFEGKDLTNKTPEERKQIEENNKKMQAADSPQAKALEAMTIAATTASNVLKDPFVNALGAVIAALGAATGVTALFTATMAKAAAGQGLLGKAGALGTKAMKLGKVGAVAGLGIAGYEAYNAQSNYKEGLVTEKQRNEQIGEAAGDAAGMAIGALIGSVLLPGIGTWIGGAAGMWLGGLAGKGIGGLFGRDNVRGNEVDPTPPTATEQQKPKVINSPSKAEEPKQGSAKAKANWRKSILEDAASKNGISDPKEKAAFMAQMDHESGGFNHMVELGGAKAGEKYEGRRDLGNTQRGDGHRFRGRGYIQLTGRANYKKYGDMVGVDLLSDPDKAAEPEIASKIAIAYWNDRKIQGKTLSEQAKAGNFDLVTKGINGGFNGKADRDMKYSKYHAAYSANGGQNITTAVNNPTPNSKLPEGAVPAQQPIATEMKAQEVKPIAQQSVQTKHPTIKAAQTTTQAMQVASTEKPTQEMKSAVVTPADTQLQKTNPVLVQLDKNSIDSLTGIIHGLKGTRSDDFTQIKNALDNMRENLGRTPLSSEMMVSQEVKGVTPLPMVSQSAAQVFNSLRTEIPKTVTTIDPVAMAGSQQQTKAPATEPSNPIVSNPIQGTADQITELRKHTELLSTLVTNTTQTRAANRNAYQRDRVSVLNGS